MVSVLIIMDIKNYQSIRKDWELLINDLEWKSQELDSQK